MNCPKHNIEMSLSSIAQDMEQKSIPFMERGQFQAVGQTGFVSYEGTRYKDSFVDTSELTYVYPHGCSFTTKAS